MIDISIVTYNSSKWLTGYFNSLINQDYPVSQINIYITDNGSTDDTLDICNIFSQKKLFANFHIESKDNLGFGCGHNNNFQYCKSDFILVSNVDLTYEYDSIIKLVQFAKKDDSDVASWEMRQKPYEHPKLYNPITLETSWSSSACVLLRKSAIDKIGGYEPRIFMYGEDVELSWRLRANGYKLKYYPKAVCWHYTYEESKFKKMQFLGSTLANLYLRARYGSVEDIKQGEEAYQNLIQSQEQYVGQKTDLIKNFEIYKSEFNYFKKANLNQQNVAKFINTWDYELVRDGAYYENKPFPAETPLVSVLIRTYKGRGIFLKDAIKSVLNQTYSNFEIIVVEDGGNTHLDVINWFNDIRIKYFASEKVGRCVTGNIALEKSSGKYCIFLDDDDYFYCDHLEVLVSEILSNPKTVKAVYSNSFEIGTDTIKDKNNIISYIESDSLVLHSGYLHPFDRTRMWTINFIPIQTILFERVLFEKLGGFDLSLDNLEDWNLWTRYSCVCDFKYIAKTTSSYRVPFDENLKKERLSKLNDYYKIALSKQNSMIIELPLITIINDFKVLNDKVSELQLKLDILNTEHNNIVNSLFWRYTSFIRKVIKKYKLRAIFLSLKNF